MKKTAIGGPDNLGFESQDTVSRIAKHSQKIREEALKDPRKAAMLAEADAAMAEIEDIFWGGCEETTTKDGQKVYRARRFADDEFIETLKADRRKGETPQQAFERHITTIKKMQPGNMYKVGAGIFYKTVQGELQETSAYIYRLEKTLIELQKRGPATYETHTVVKDSEQAKLIEELTKLKHLSGWEYLKMGFKKLWAELRL